jgi:hypothetical protein
MGTLAELFRPLMDAVERHNRERGLNPRHSWHHRLLVKERQGLIDVEYRGEYQLWFDDSPAVLILNDLCELFTTPAVAPHLNSFTFRTAAALAANGTYDFNIDPLVRGNVRFPNLTRFILDQGEGEHGYKILTSPASGDNWNEAGVLARLIANAPRLVELASPSPPNADFFRGRHHPLRQLDIDAGFDHSQFIRRLAGCQRFPELERLTFTDYRQTYMTDWQTSVTPFEDYERLFRSPVLAGLRTVSLRSVSLTPQQIGQLRSIRRQGVSIIPLQA